MPKASLVSVVEDDQFFRESMRRLMRSLGYSVEAFPSAADFLASPRLVETACLIADVHMPAMTGLELHRRLIDAGNAIPTILVTAYPDDNVRARALNDGVVCRCRPTRRIAGLPPPASGRNESPRLPAAPHARASVAISASGEWRRLKWRATSLATRSTCLWRSKASSRAARSVISSAGRSSSRSSSSPGMRAGGTLR